MLIKINIGGVWVYFGRPNATLRPSPFYPYLLSVSDLNDPVGSETGSASFLLSLEAKALIGLNLRRPVEIRDSANQGSYFTGLIGGVEYSDHIVVKVEA